MLLLALEQTDNFKPQATGTEHVHMPNTTPCEMYTFLGIVYVRQFTGLTRRTHQHNVKQISKIEAYERKNYKVKLNMKHGNQILFYSDIVETFPFVNTSGLKMNTIILVL